MSVGSFLKDTMTSLLLSALFLIGVTYILSPQTLTDIWNTGIMAFALTTDEPTTTSISIPTTTTTEQVAFPGQMIEYATGLDPDSLEYLEKRTFDLVNQERVDLGLAPLVWNGNITVVCRAHSLDMLENDFVEHDGTDGRTSKQRVLDGDVKYFNVTGENVAQIPIFEERLLTAGKVVNLNPRTYGEIAEHSVYMWMESPRHKTNILNSVYDEAGMGIVVNGTDVYLTQDFISRIGCAYEGGPCCVEVNEYVEGNEKVTEIVTSCFEGLVCTEYYYCVSTSV